MHIIVSELKPHLNFSISQFFARDRFALNVTGRPMICGALKTRLRVNGGRVSLVVCFAESWDFLREPSTNCVADHELNRTVLVI
jgi:hypothetical protein